MLRLLMILGITTLLYLNLEGQRWTSADLSDIPQKGDRDIIPEKYGLYELDDHQMRQLLWSAPHESDTDVHQSNVSINIMMPDGESDIFKIVQYDMMEAELAAKYNDIRTYYGISESDPYRSVRIDYTVHGFRAVIRDIGYQVFIDHYQRNDKNIRIVYYRHDYKKAPKWGCDVVTDERNAHDHNHGERGVLIGDCQLRTYRLAQATAGEYSNYHGATSSQQSNLVMSAVVNVINRINQVYEAEVAVRLNLVNNNDQLFFYTPSTDPYTATDASTMLGQNISTCNSTIGASNYDIGHVFGGLGNNGVAYLGSVCTSSKAGGVTTSTVPVGDPFSIDYVAHEMGHQFGANHTQNNNCNRNSSTSMEPGSASTIMGYAGICSPNVQSASDAYFHAISLQEIKNFIAGNGNSCAQIVGSFVNTAPTVTIQSNYSIPISTPFILTLSASDPNGHPLTYAWEQMDNQVATMPPVSTSTGGPAFRSIFATSSPTRFFPPLSNVIANTTNTWQVLPSVARTMNFRGVARDFTGVAGCNNEINITVSTVNAAAGAFSVTSFNTASNWLEGETKTITWNVAGTNTAPINAPNVDILLSYDGGNTFPVILLAGTPNDGSENIIVPAGLTTQGRIMVRGTNHIFYDINNANINIQPGFPGFEITVNPSTESICIGTSKQLTINTQSILGYSAPINLSLSGLPVGMSSSFSINPVNPGSLSTLTLTNNSVSPGSYTITLVGVSGTLNINRFITIQVPAALGGIPNLNSPGDNATEVDVKPLFSWSLTANASSYDLQVSKNNNFNSFDIDVNVSTNSFQVLIPLDDLTTHYWRVRAKNLCGQSEWSLVRTFETQPCFTYQAADLPINISASGTPVINSYLNITDRGTITDLDVINLTGTHTWVNDLRFRLFTPQNTFQTIWNRPCGSEDNFNINFDQSAPSGSWPCPPTDGGTYRPSNTLNFYNNLPQKGVWRLQVEDLFNQDGGSLQSWGIKSCLTNFCRLSVDNENATGVGSLAFAINCAASGDTIRFVPGFTNKTINLGASGLEINKNLIIEANPAANIHVISTSANPTITNLQQTKIIGLYIHAPSANAPAILNNRILELENVHLIKYPGGNTTLLNTAILDIKGYCNIID